MTKEEVQRKIQESFNDGAVNIAMIEKSKSLIAMGIEHDADSICHISKTGESISVIFVVGRSVLMGAEAHKWISEYHNNSPSAIKRCIEAIADFAIEGLADGEECIMPFVDTKNKAWRAFRIQAGGAVQTVDEIRKKALFKLGRPVLD